MTGFSNADHASGMRSREDVDIKTALGTFRFRDPSLFESALFLTINSLFSFFFVAAPRLDTVNEQIRGQIKK